MQKGRMKGNAQRGAQLAFGSFGIKAMESTWITGRQIEAARQAIVRCMKREGQIWIRIFPDKPITKKPAEVRMGKGKGSPEGFVAPVTPGRILFEAEIRELTVAEIEERIDAEKANLLRQKLNHSVSPVENPTTLKKARRDIARMMTILAEKQNVKS